MEDLFGSEEQAVDDYSVFEPKPVERGTLKAEPSKKNLMLQSAVIQGGNLVEGYQNLAAMSEEERTVYMQDISARAKQNETDLNLEVVSTLIQNPDLTDSAKENLLSSMIGESKKPMSSLRKTAESLYISATGKETPAEERRMASVAELIEPTVEIAALKQKVITALSVDEQTGKKVSIVNNPYDLLEHLAPFYEQAFTFQVRQKIDSGEISTGQQVVNALLLGEAKVDGRQAFLEMSTDQKKKFLEDAVEMINGIRSYTVFNDNDLAQLDNIMAIIEEGYYTTTDRVLDDVGSILDTLPIVNIIYRAGLKPATKAAKAATMSALVKAGIRKGVTNKQPASVISLAEQANPSVAREMAKAINDDETGEVAEVVAGTTRTDAIVEMSGPQINTPDGSIIAKPYDLDHDILNAAYLEGSKMYRTPDELARYTEQLSESFGTIAELRREDKYASSHKVMDNGTIQIAERYVAKDGGFQTPEAAIKAALEHLEYYGVKEKDLTILQKVGDEYVPTTAKDVLGKKVAREVLQSWPIGKKVGADKLKQDFILKKKEELLADQSSRLERGDRKNLLAEKQDLEYRLSKVTEGAQEKVIKLKGVPARKAKKDAKTAPKLEAEAEKAMLSERLSLIDSKLKASAKGEEAEANLSRLEQGIIPKEFEGEFNELLKKSQGAEKPTKPIEIPEELKKINMQDDFAVEVKFNYSPRAIDIIDRDDLDVKLNFLDSLSTVAPTPGSSTPSKRLFASSYMLDPVIVQASVAAVDQGNRLTKVIMDKANEGIFKPLKDMPKANAQRISKIITEQNLSRKVYSVEELTDKGVVEEAEIKVLDNWKYMNDQLWHLYNMDMAKTLRNNGFSMYQDSAKGDKYVGKVLPANTALGNRPTKVYDPTAQPDPTTGKVGETVLTSQMWDELQASGGQVFKLKESQLIDGIEVEYIVVKAGDSGRYVKAIQETDHIMNYIPGHSHISYKDPFFLERVMVDANGKEITGTRQAILTSPDSASAEIAVQRLTAGASDALKGRTWKYTKRNAKELTPVEIALRRFEVASSAGLSAQRKRGQTLKQFDSTRSTDMSPNIADPLDSFKQSVAEISKRAPLREYLDDLEQRIISQYGNMLPKDDWGNPRLPNTGEKLTGGDVAGTKDAARMADLKTTLEHYNYMKFGYYNSIDAGYKFVLNKLSQFAGYAARRIDESGKTGKLASAVRAASIKSEKAVGAVLEEVPSLTGALKGMAFNAHIAISAPPSQWMVQGLPALMTSLLYPKYISSGGVVRDLNRLRLGIIHADDVTTLEKAVGKAKAEEIMQLKAEWDKTGLGVGVDKHLIVETGLENMMPTGRFSKIKGVHDAIVETGRKVGFDLGETVQLMTYWLAVRNDAVTKGLKMSDARVFDQVRAKTRTLTMNMNKAGEMPWNKDSLSLWTQFMISPYKALTMYLDRGLTLEEKAKVAVWQGLVMPLPGFMSKYVRANSPFEVTGEEGDAATEIMTNGLLGGMYNTALNAMFEGHGSPSWERNVQFDPSYAGVLTLIQHLSGDLQGMNLMQAVAQSSPSLSMISPDTYNPIAFNLMKSFGKMVTAPLYDDVKFLDTAKAFAGENGALWQYSALGRGMSTAWKELFWSETQKRYSSLTGSEQDDHVSTMESIYRGLFGMQTTKQAIMRQVNNDLHDGNREAKKEIDNLVKELEREATQLGFNVDDDRRAEYILRHYAMAFPDGRIPPKSAEYLLSQLRPNMTLTQKLLSLAGYGYGDEAKAILERAGENFNDEVKSNLNFFRSNEAAKQLSEEE